MFLDNDIFSTVIASTPLVSIDLVVKNSKGQYLLGHRKNRPAEGFWFVPGGRILKDESMDNAFLRLTKNELSVEVSKQTAVFLGLYEHFYDDYVFGIEQSTHYVVLAYQMNLDIELTQLPQEQHNQYRWFSQSDLLNSKSVHENSKAYLK